MFAGQSVYRILLATVAIGLTAQAEDWPRFRGPNGSGVSASVVPTEFGMDKNLVWKFELPGRGVSCPIVVGEKIFVTCYSGYGVEGGSREIEDLKRHLICLDKSGSKLWDKTIPATMPEDPFRGAGVPAHGYASHTPVSDGKSVFVFFGKSGVFAFDLDGKQLWKQSVGTGSGEREWGSAASPIEFEDVVIVNASDESETLFAFDKKTGKEKWKAKAGGLADTWGTPILMQSKTGPEVVLGVPYELWSLDARTGKLKWYADASEGASHSIIAGLDGQVISAGGRGGQSTAVRVGGKDDVNKKNVAWSGSGGGRFATPVLYKDHFYTVSNGVLSSYDAKTGKRVGQARVPGASSRGGSGRGRGGVVQASQRGRSQRGGQRRRGGFGGGDYASPVIAGGKIYVTMNSGMIHVFEATPEMKLVGTNDMSADKSGFAATPAISDGRLYLRSHAHLYCVGVK